MAQDVFDTLTEPQTQSGDIFDSVAEESAGDIFDSVAPPEPKSTTPATDQAVAQTAEIAETKKQQSWFMPQSPASIDIQDAKLAREVGSQPMIQLPHIPESPDDSQLQRFEKATGNMLRDFVSGATSAEGLAGILLPPYGIAQMVASAPEVWDEVVRSEQTPPGSHERWNAGVKMVSLIGTLGLAGHGMQRGITKSAPVRTAEAPDLPARPITEPADAPVYDSMSGSTEQLSGLTEQSKLSAPLEEPATIPKPLAAAEKIEGAELTYINGNRAEYTGEIREIAGGTFHVVKITEGTKAGQEAVTMRPPSGPDPFAEAQQAQWQSEQADFRKLNEPAPVTLGADIGARKVRPGQQDRIDAAKQTMRDAINKDDYASPKDRADAIASARERVNEAVAGIEEKPLISNEQPQIEQPVQKGGEITSAVEPGVEGAITEIQRRNAPDDPYAQYRTAPAERSPEPTAPLSPEETGIPEYLRPNPEILRLIETPEAKTGPQMKFAEAPEGGAIFGIGGRKPKIKPIGETPRGDTEFLQVNKPFKRLGQGLEREGVPDVIGRTRNKVGKLLSDATQKHVDLEQEIYGQLYSKFEKATQGQKGTVNQAFEEIKPHLAAKENGRPLPALSTKAREILDAWETIADDTGKIAIANKVQVFDPALNANRPMHAIGRSYVPRMMKTEVERVMRDPASNPQLWNQMVGEISKQRGIRPADAATYLRKESSRFSANDFMGNLEMARQSKLPESFYDYDLRNIASRYIPAFSERMAQIIAYGQRLGPRDAPTRPNLWDVAREESADTYTANWLREAEDQAVNLKPRTTAKQMAARGQTLASGLLLSGPVTVMRNTLSGLTSTTELLGIRRSLAPMIKTVTSAQSRMGAREIGAVRDDMGNFLHADKLGESFVDDAVRTITNQSLKYSGYTGSEVFVRSHAALTATQFAKDGVAALNLRPTSRRSKETLGMFKRMGVDAEKIVAENADWKTGPETRKFVRTVIRDTQGGYRFDQVPLWANSNTGRFFYQFGRWGTQRARNVWKNGIKPALGEEVRYRGKTMHRVDPAPLLKMLAGSVVLGEAYGIVSSTLFDRDRTDSSLTEIREAWDEDKLKATGLAFERVINDVIMSGMLGIWGQPLDFMKGLKDQSRFKNPVNPPALASVKALMDLGQTAFDQNGQLTKKDVLYFSASFMPQVKQTTDIVRNVIDEPIYEAQNDVRSLRNAARRWAQGAGLDVSPRNKGGSFRKSEQSIAYEPIKEALLLGDVVTADARMKAYLATQPNKKQALTNLKASVRASQPFKAGPYSDAGLRTGFMQWAKTHLSSEDYEQANRIDKRYRETASRLGLFTESKKPKFSTQLQ